MRCVEPYRSSTSPLPRPRSALGLELCDGHLTHQGRGVEPIDHLWAGPGVPRQLECVDAGAVEHPHFGSAPGPYSRVHEGFERRGLG